MQCPRCRAELERAGVDCAVCGWESGAETKAEWMEIGAVDGKMFADLARETLTSMEIPNTVVSKSGYFGSVGLTLTPFFGQEATPHFEVSVPVGYAVEAATALSVTLGEKWKEKAE